MKTIYVQLESDAFLTDLDFMNMTPAERGLYLSLIFISISAAANANSDA